MSNRIEVEFMAETASLRDGIGRVEAQLGGLNRTAKSAGPTLKGVLGANIIGKAVGLAADGLGRFAGLLGDSVGEARESQKVGATTAQIIKATGGAAKVSAAQVGDLAGAISAKTGVDDEAIQAGSNLLLTFKNVRNEAGKGAQIFDRANQAAVDLSAAGFGSITGSSKMLGKALNDPVKGISALSRAGVTFTDKQKETIKQMVKTGDVLGAQKLIMAEVESQVGGVAAANATAGEKAAVMAGNLKEQFGTALLPLLDQAATFFTSVLGPAISGAIGFITPVLAQVGPAIQGVIGKIQGLLAGLGAGGGAAGFAAVFNSIKTAVTTVLPVIQQVLGTLVATFRANLPQIIAIVKQVGANFAALAELIRTVWDRVGPYLLPVIKSVMTTVIALIKSALQVVGGVIKLVTSLIKGDWSGAWNAVKQIASAVWSAIKAIVTNGARVTGQIVKALGALVKAAWSTIKAATSAAWNAVKTVISAAISAAAAAIRTKINSAKAAVSSAWSAVKSLTSSAWSSFVSTITSKVGAAVAVVRGLPGKVRSALSGAGSLLVGAGRNLIQGFINGISGSIGAVISKARSIASAAVSAVKGALGIHSPSRVFLELGRYVGEGFSLGLQGSEADVKAAAKKLATEALKAVQAGDISFKQYLKIVKKVYTADDRLLANARSRTQVAGQLTAAETRLNDQLKIRADYAASVVSNARQFAAVTGIESPENATLDSKIIVQGLQDRLNAITNFHAKLDQLKRLGLNSTTYDQIVAAGVEGGMDELNALVAGGRTAVTQVNNLQGKINAATALLGTTTADTLYKAGIDAQRGLINGLLSDQTALVAAAKKLADTLAKEVRRALGIKSPSRVFKGIGDYVTQGLIVGLDQDAAARAARILAGSVVSGFGIPTLATAGGASSARAGGNNYHITVQVPLGTSKAEVGREIVTMIKEYEKAGGR